jgi:hypothetical protein
MYYIILEPQRRNSDDNDYEYCENSEAEIFAVFTKSNANDPTVDAEWRGDIKLADLAALPRWFQFLLEGK